MHVGEVYWLCKQIETFYAKSATLYYSEVKTEIKVQHECYD